MGIRPVTLFTGQWADLKLADLCPLAKQMGYDGLELACWGDHFDPHAAIKNDSYCEQKRALLEKHGLKCFAISNHLAGQAVLDNIDARHQSILPEHVWGNGNPADVNKRAADEMIVTAQAAQKFGVKVVNGFTGSSIWHLLYSFPPVPPAMIDAGYQLLYDRWVPILNEFGKLEVKFALEVHPTEIAFDIASTRRTLKALDNHMSFGFNYDPSHLGYQGVNYLKFLREFAERIFHVHMKDVAWNLDDEAGVFGGHTEFHQPGRYWDFKSVGRGMINFNRIIFLLNHMKYSGPLSVEWEQGDMDREFGATESCDYVKKIDYPTSDVAFDAAFSE